MDSFRFIPIPPRTAKPRNQGLTMLLDKGLDPVQLEGILATSGDYIDIVKFGWATSRILPREILIKKIALLRDRQISVCPGGTFLELAYVHDMMGKFLEEAKSLGFTCVEVSDGTVQIPRDEKLRLIEKAKKAGFEVYSEIGKKSPFEDEQISTRARIEDAHAELSAGALKVIMESRESGTTGIYDSEGHVIQESLDELVLHVGITNIIFEAPKREQQVWLIGNLGNAINLGNVAPEDALNVETLRLGLRSDTLKEYHLNRISVRIENGALGAWAATSRHDVIIVIDALRASATIIAALAAGIGSIRPVSSFEGVFESTDKCLTAGERGGRKLPGTDYDNSPITFRDQTFHGEHLILTTTNGTECIQACAHGDGPILIGTLINAAAVAQKAMRLAADQQRDVSIVMAGRNNSIAHEDLVSASGIVKHFSGCTVKGHIQPIYKQDPAEAFLQSDSGKNLVGMGKRDDVLFCAQESIYNVVPTYQNGIITLFS